MTNLFSSKKLVLTLFLFSLISCLIAQENDFDATVEEDDKKTATGGFGADLAKNLSFVNFNGYITNEFFAGTNGGNSTFDNHYFNVFISSQLTDKIFIEGQLEYEHGGQDIDVRYAYADYKVSEAFVIRSGKFLVPAGQFNEYLYPEYLNKTVSRAYVNREISPSAWGEVGVQIRGRFDSGGSAIPFYSVYAVNGLNGNSGDGIRNLRGNARDSKGGNENKAFGGAFGVDIGKDITVAANYYSGKYSTDNELNLSIMGASFYMDKEKFSIWSEMHLAKQEAYNDAADVTQGVSDLDKSGFYIQGGYMITEKLEPIIRYDAIKLDGAPDADRSRITLGANYYLAKTAVVKVNYELVSDDGADPDDNLFGVQLSVGF
ncbi:porin [Ekhidna sp.]|uniref:porin n=1 Tax=Ekhidna sp. TaxID=2608089 RepID=UPI00329708FA